MSPDSVFKAYDVRGRTDNGELTPDLYRKIGGAFVSLVDGDEIAIGRDCRESSIALFDALVDGITAVGADVVDLGLVPTDLVYFYSGKYRARSDDHRLAQPSRIQRRSCAGQVRLRSAPRPAWQPSRRQ